MGRRCVVRPGPARKAAEEKEWRVLVGETEDSC
jgi:hypothetical protein